MHMKVQQQWSGAAVHIACWDMERVVAWDGSEIAVRDVNCALQELAVRSGWLCCAAACRGNRRLQYGTTTCLKHGHDQERQHQKRRQHRVRFLANCGSCRARRHAHLLARSGARMQTARLAGGACPRTCTRGRCILCVLDLVHYVYLVIG